VYEYVCVEKFGEYQFEIQRRLVYRYDEEGNNIQELEYNSDGEFRGFNYKYDDRGRVVEVFGFGSNNHLYQKFNYKYDDRGRVIEKEKYEGLFGLLSCKFTGMDVYKYDERGV